MCETFWYANAEKANGSAQLVIKVSGAQKVCATTLICDWHMRAIECHLAHLMARKKHDLLTCKTLKLLHNAKNLSITGGSNQFGQLDLHPICDRDLDYCGFQGIYLQFFASIGPPALD